MVLPDHNWPPPPKALLPLVRALARATARACHNLKIEPDMDDPVVAREMLAMTFDAMLWSKPAARRRRKGEASAPLSR